jgi:hypothetical protein
MAANREGQKQLHAWISAELKADLEEYRDEHETTYTAILTDALELYFEKLEADPVTTRLDRIEQRLGELAATLDDGPADNLDATTEDAGPFDAPTEEMKTTPADEDPAPRQIIRRREE